MGVNKDSGRLTGSRASTEPCCTVSAVPVSVPNAEFYKELRSVLADCSDFLGDTTLGDRCEVMLSQVVADEPERLAEVSDLRAALVDHNDALRSAAQVADRDGKGTNWLTFRGHVHWVLSEHHEITNEARAASAIEAPSGVETGNTDSTEGESAAPKEDAQ